MVPPTTFIVTCSILKGILSMQRTMCKGKIHRATVTQANLNYIGSITIDQDLLEAADIYPYEKVQVVNISNGSYDEQEIRSLEPRIVFVDDQNHIIETKCVPLLAMLPEAHLEAVY